MEKRREKRKYRRMFTKDELKEAAKILSYHFPPLECECGGREFNFTAEKDILEALCTKCGAHYIFNEKTREWRKTSTNEM